MAFSQRKPPWAPSIFTRSPRNGDAPERVVWARHRPSRGIVRACRRRIVIAVTHADDPLGSRVVARSATPVARDRGRRRQPTCGCAELKRTLDGVDTVVHLAVVTDEPLEATRRVLDAAADAGVEPRRGASAAPWSTAPGPPTRCRSPRTRRCAPTPASRRRSRSARSSGWSPSGATPTRRPPSPCSVPPSPWPRTPAAGSPRCSPPSAACPSARTIRPPSSCTSTTSPRAVAVARRRPASTAPPTWPPTAGSPATTSGPSPAGPRVRLPGRLAERLTSWRWRAGLSPTPPGLLPWTVHPWVVAATGCAALGWAPTHSNEEAFVAGHGRAVGHGLAPPPPGAHARHLRRRARRRCRGGGAGDPAPAPALGRGAAPSAATPVSRDVERG